MGDCIFFFVSRRAAQDILNSERQRFAAGERSLRNLAIVGLVGFVVVVLVVIRFIETPQSLLNNYLKTARTAPVP